MWDVRTGQKLRAFAAVSAEWPAFKWSFDDKFFARLKDDSIYVYEAPSMNLNEGKAIKVPGIRDFAWSPTDLLLAFWLPEQDQSPARVTILSMPARKDVAHKNLFNVIECKLFWHPDGTYLCAKAERHTKSKKSTFTNFELFRIREKNFPVDVLEIKEVRRRLLLLAVHLCGRARKQTTRQA